MKAGLPFVSALLGLALGGLAGAAIFSSNQETAQRARDEAIWLQVDRFSAAQLRAFLDVAVSRPHRRDAQDTLISLEQRRYDTAIATNTIAYYEDYLRDFPDDNYAVDIERRLRRLIATAYDPPTARARFSGTAGSMEAPP